MKTFKLTNAQFDMVFAALRWAADSDYNEFTEPLTRRERLALDRGIEAMRKARSAVRESNPRSRRIRTTTVPTAGGW